ncbi:MAG: hypothetical protein WDN02_10560 [Methylovirgula sp.]|uniref:hypothetical protein n=1 Tax=Methylovirgula sp. TaxID=1978224 RepID=UPI0030767471
MNERKVAVYYAWSRPGETEAPLAVIEDRFPSLFESRRLVYPRFHELSDPVRFDQSIAGFLDHIMKANFIDFAEQASTQTGHPVLEVERVADDGTQTPLNHILSGIDTLIIISFDSLRTEQAADAAEVNAVRAFLDDPDHLVFVCPHHEIGAAEHLSDDDRLKLQEAEFLHHGDRTIPPQQRFGGLARSLLAGLGIPVENHFGLRPAAAQDGSPAPIEIESSLDRLKILNGVPTFNLHPHLPHLERLGDAKAKLDVLARQQIDLTAPPHAFVQSGHSTFDAMLQSRPETFPGTLLVGDTTLFSSTAGGLESLRHLWANIVGRPRAS